MIKLQKGDKAPDFKGKNQNGELKSLKDYKGKKVVLYFYPKDNTPTCTDEACNLRDNYKALLKNGYAVIGISCDSEKSHKKFADKFDLPFDLIADENRTIVNAYGIWGPKKFMGREFDGIHRTTFVIDEKGRIEEIIEKVTSKKHTEQILK